MLTFIFLAFFAGLPILAYLLASKTKSKGIIFGLSAIILSVCLFIYISKFSILGSLNKQILKNKIVDEIYVNSKIATQNLVSIENVLEKDEIQIWLISLISKAIELNKLTSAESLVTFSEKFFDSNEEKLIFYINLNIVWPCSINSMPCSICRIPNPRICVLCSVIILCTCKCHRIISN